MNENKYILAKDKTGEDVTLRQVMNDDETYTFPLTRNSDKAYYDNYDTGELDVGDFKKSDRIFQAGQFAHILEERWSNAPNFSIENRTDDNYYSSHDCGMITEATVVCGMLKIGYSYPVFSRTINESLPDSRGNTYQYFWETTKYGSAIFGGKGTANRSKGNRFKPGNNLINKMKRVK
jgi:hypothetical protein